MIGQFVKITGSSSVFDDFLGRYGVVKEYAYGDKWVIEFNARVGDRGLLAHTVSEKDFEVINQVNPMKKGKWIKGEVKWSCDCEWNCSVCGDIVSLLEGHTPQNAEMNFCPYCGADMREEENE